MRVEAVRSEIQECRRAVRLLYALSRGDEDPEVVEAFDRVGVDLYRSGSLDIETVKRLCCLSKSSWYSQNRTGRFPAPDVYPHPDKYWVKDTWEDCEYPSDVQWTFEGDNKLPALWGLVPNAVTSLNSGLYEYQPAFCWAGERHRVDWTSDHCWLSKERCLKKRSKKIWHAPTEWSVSIIKAWMLKRLQEGYPIASPAYCRHTRPGDGRFRRKADEGA